MTYEREINRKHIAPAPETVADRRGGIQNRGRAQQRGEGQPGS